MNNRGDISCKTIISIDKDRIIGDIKPMHCTNNLADMRGVFDKAMAAAGIPYARLHDTSFINPHLVDIHAVFPDFSADENNPDSYDFAFTDFFIKRIVDAGIKPFYRLGESIENFHYIKPYYIHPPKDFKKWARVCGKIIAHYNHGWANGFYYNIEYWEIWNEPDNYPDIADNAMWKGTMAQYFELYNITSNYLKGLYPDIKIGGYASCGFYAILEEESARQANISPRTGYFLDFFKEFLDYITAPKTRSPLDFFSWHSYSSVKSNIRYANYARQTLDKYGLHNTENHLNEWNPDIMQRGTVKDASNICANMLALQDTSLDMLMYYDARMSAYCGLFDPVNNKVFPAYYTFKAFNELYKIKKQTALTIKGSTDIYAVSAYDGKSGAVLVTNNADTEQALSIEGIGMDSETLSLTASCLLEPVSANLTEYICAPFESILILYKT